MEHIKIASAIVGIELTKEEVEMIMKKREKDARRARRDGYIAEMKDLLARAKADGFTFGHKAKTWAINEVKPWGDAADSWIQLD